MDNDEDTATEAVVIVPTAVVADPFNTDIASEVLPNKGDPFDTTYVKGDRPGRAETKALEDEFLDPEGEFDPREGSKAPTKIVAAGIHISPHIQIHLHSHLHLNFTDDFISEQSHRSVEGKRMENWELKVVCLSMQVLLSST